MKKLFFLTALIGMTPLAAMAQEDDLYFTPKDEVENYIPQEQTSMQAPVYYSGSDRDVDEYNRQGRYSSYYQKIGSDSLGNDILTFHPGDGLYPDNSYEDTAYVYPGSMSYDMDYDNGDDYTYSRLLSLYDGYYSPFSAWNYGFGPYWNSWYGWGGPWSWYYGYDPFFYGGGYPYYGWNYPYWDGGYGGWYGGGHYAYNTGHTGTLGYYDRSNYRNNGRVGSHNGRGTFGSGRAGITRGTSRGNIGFGSNRRAGTTRSYQRPNRTYQQPNRTYNSTPSYSRPSGGGASFGGSRGGGVSRGGGGGFHGGGRR